MEIDLPSWSGLRRDVDIPADLTAEYALRIQTSELMQSWRETYSAIAVEGLGIRSEDASVKFALRC